MASSFAHSSARKFSRFLTKSHRPLFELGLGVGSGLFLNHAARLRHGGIEILPHMKAINDEARLW